MTNHSETDSVTCRDIALARLSLAHDMLSAAGEEYMDHLSVAETTAFAQARATIARIARGGYNEGDDSYSPDSYPDMRRALQEGWIIALSGDRGWEIQRDDSSDMIASDDEAVMLVHKRAAAGSAYHSRCLDFIGVDRESSTSRQHFIDTGLYLPREQN